MVESNKNIIISVITPSFNRADFLEKNILSIIDQSCPYVEHIVVDGGSNDNTLNVLKKYQGTYNLKWISEKDNGCADAMEKGFNMASGDILCWLDSDDFYLPGTLNKIIKLFDQEKDTGVIFGDMMICDKTGKIIDYVRHTDLDIDALIYTGMVLNPQATFWRRSVHQKIKGFNTNYKRAADYDFFIRMALTGEKFHYLRDFLSVYRHHESQLTKSIQLCIEEGREISLKYVDKNIIDKDYKAKKIKIALKRAVMFIKQGDVWYLVRSILRKLKLFPEHRQ